MWKILLIMFGPRMSYRSRETTLSSLAASLQFNHCSLELLLFTVLFLRLLLLCMIWRDKWFALENWQTSCQFDLAHKL